MHRKLTLLLCIAGLFLFLLFPEQTSESAKSGLNLWACVIVPSLFPFICLSDYIVSDDRFQKVLSNPYYSIIYAIILGLFCGYPMGGKVLNDLVSKDKIPVKTASLLLPAINQASPMFLLTYVKSFALCNILSTQKLLIYIYTPSILYLIFCILYIILEKNKSRNNSLSICSVNNSSNADLQTDTSLQIQKSILTIFQIGITIMFYSIVTGLLYSLIKSNTAGSVLSFLEITIGLSTLKINALPIKTKTALMIALTIFGGCSSISQTNTVITVKGLSILHYTIVKILMAFSGISIYLFTI